MQTMSLRQFFDGESLRGVRDEALRRFLASPRVVLRGGGDVATGVAQALWRAGFEVVILETARPSAIRRSVALSEAVFVGETQVEDLIARRVAKEEVDSCLREGVIPVLIDPEGSFIRESRAYVVIDAILAKRNLGTDHGTAPLTMALGPGFSAGPAKHEVDLVIETMRGHRLGRWIENGAAAANTGVPGVIGGRSRERVLYSPRAGLFRPLVEIGAEVKEGQIIAVVEAAETDAATSSCGTERPPTSFLSGETEPDLLRLTEAEALIRAPFDGIVRGILPDGYPVPAHFKSGDLDPRKEEKENCFTISDKARALGNAAVSGLWYLLLKKEAEKSRMDGRGEREDRGHSEENET